MKKLRPLLLVATFASVAACAGQRYRLDVGAMFARATGDVALQSATNSLDLGSNQNDLDRNLGLGDTEPAPYVRAEVDAGPHRARFHGFAIDADGSGQVNDNGNGTSATDNGFGDIDGGSAVSTSLRFFAIGATYAYGIVAEENFRFGAGLALNYYSLDIGARSAVTRESVFTDVLVPMPYLEIEGMLGPLTAGANFGLMSADLGDASGRYLDTEAYLRWQANDQFDFLVGYRYLVLDGAGSASSRDFDADVDVQGLFVGGGVRF